MTPESETAKQQSADTRACQFIIEFLSERTSIRLSNGKEALIRARLSKRMRHYGFESLAEYCKYLKNEADEQELTLVVDALTTNFTSFLREDDHFQFLVKRALPGLLSDGDRKFRVWSAGCSSGEEPYSIAFYLSEYFPLSAGWDWKIIATDISTRVLDAAKQAVYTQERVQGLPREWLPRYFQKGVGRWAGHCRIKRGLTERVSFQQQNIIEPFEHPQPFQVIFCRNVMIYFNRAAQEKLIKRICRFLAPGGWLMIGHSESLHALDAPLRCIQPSIYQKTIT